MKKIFKIILLICLPFFSICNTINASEEKIKIGLLVPLTGDDKSLGQLLIKSTQMALEDIVQKNFSNGKQPSPQVILCLASFKALNEYKWCDLLTVESAIEKVFKRQVLEPNQEARIKLKIPTLQEISDKVSLKVRHQY